MRAAAAGAEKQQHTRTHVGPSKVFAPQITTHEHHHHNKIKLCAAGDISEPNRLGSGIM
jgi:hypothetical protein